MKTCFLITKIERFGASPYNITSLVSLPNSRDLQVGDIFFFYPYDFYQAMKINKTTVGLKMLQTLIVEEEYQQIYKWITIRANKYQFETIGIDSEIYISKQFCKPWDGNDLTIKAHAT